MFKRSILAMKVKEQKLPFIYIYFILKCITGTLDNTSLLLYQ